MERMIFEQCLKTGQQALIRQNCHTRLFLEKYARMAVHARTTFGEPETHKPT
jgi:hypothetical protein